MSLKKFCENLFKEDGFVLIDANSKEYIIGKPIKQNPIKLKLLDKSLHYKLLLLPDLYSNSMHRRRSSLLNTCLFRYTQAYSHSYITHRVSFAILNKLSNSTPPMS